jgi:hypothetical protein
MSWYSNIVPVHNGNLQVKETTKGDVKNLINQMGWQDWSTLTQWFEEDPLQQSLRLQQWFGMKEEQKVPSIFRDALENNAVLEVNGWGGKFKYDLPVETDNRIKTTDDMSHQQYAGMDGTTFKIVFNREFAPGTQLTCDGLDGEALVVSDAEPVRVTTSGFEHTVTLLTEDRDKTYPSYLLGSDIQYWDLATNLAEYSEKFGIVHMPEGTEYNTYEFELGSPIGYETFTTAKADMTSLRGGSASSMEFINELERFYKNGSEVVVIKDNAPNATHKYTVATILEMLTIKKFHTAMSAYLMFSKGGVVTTTKGTTRYNEGLWRQMRRGYIITYGKRGGIMKSHLMQAKDYVFRANHQLSDVETRLKFKCGTRAFENVIEIFKDEVSRQLGNIGFLLGAERLIPNPVSGSLYELSLKPVRFTEVYLPGIGLVEIEEDRSLNYSNVQDKNISGMHPDGYDWTSYSMIIWDAADQYYSNNNNYPQGTAPVNGGNNEANIYMITPRDRKIFWGHENGRYSSRQATDIVASGKTMHESFFIWGFGAMWMKDPSRFVTIELEKPARKGYN